MNAENPPMRALHLGPEGPTLRTDHPTPERAPGQALLRLLRAGICSTDLELIKGYYGYEGVLGHEFVAEVESADDPAWLGRRVVGSINLGCRRCPVCVGHGPEHCPHRTVLGIVAHDGAFADHLVLPEVNLHAVPHTVEDRRAVFVEPLAAALRIREQVVIPADGRVAVVGPGRLGLLIAQVMALGGARPTVLGRREESLELPARWGMATGLAKDAEDASFDLVVEATGNEAGLAESLRMIRPEGTLVLKSTFEGAAEVDLTPLVVNEIRVVGSRCGPFAPALRLLEQGAVDVLSLVEAEYALDDAMKALEHAERPGVLKVQLVA
jgi:threonine dehydrogenase-like Zn-dependent dehydrogenase